MDLSPVERELLELDLGRLDERNACAAGPARLMRHMRCFDERSVEEFGFNMDDPDGPWFWQREVVDRLLAERRLVVLKARQIGVTWLGCAVGVWTALFRPGSLCLFYRQKEDDAVKLVRRAWFQFRSLPAWLREGIEVLVPARGAEPTTTMRLRFPDGRISQIIGMSSAEASGHGDTCAFALLDEFSRIDKAGEIMKAVSSAVGTDGLMFIVSTANGVSNEQTGGGNYFHYLYQHAAESGLGTMFLSWKQHPDRDQHWYDTSPEIRSLRPFERAEQYPSNEAEAFTFSNAIFFDGDALMDYGARAQEPVFRGEFVATSAREARLVKKDNGWISVWEFPHEDHSYAVGVDTATGRGLDFSAAYVVDLATNGIVAEFHGKLDADLYAAQLHFLGRWFNTALMAVESAGGFGDSVIITLRDGIRGRPAYPKLYRHRQFVRGDQPEHKPFGFPMTKSTRAPILNYLEEVVRERQTPHLPARLLDEMKTFIRFNPNKPDATGTWPRAQDGCNDDRVMAAAIAFEMFRQHGEHPRKVKRRAKRPAPHWLAA